MPEKKIKPAVPEFAGFTPEAQDFFWELQFNNERPWFKEHKEQFEKCLNTPFKALAMETEELMHKSFPDVELNLHISKIYRDARRLFGRGPYKDNLWFTLMQHQGAINAPAFFFEITPRGYSYGMGYYCEKPSEMEKFRKTVASNPTAFERLALEAENVPGMMLEGELYKKPKGNFGEVINRWYNRKWMSLVSNNDYDEKLFSPDLPHVLAETFEQLMPMYEYFNTISMRED